MMQNLSGKKIAILATNGFEQSELEGPQKALKDAGATVEVVSPEKGEIKGWQGKDWGRPVKVDRLLADANSADYDAIVIPGGQINPDLLRVNENAVGFVKEFYSSGKPIAAICHAPWVLIEAGIMRGRKATSYKSIKTDVINAGAEWQDAPVVTDQGIITSRQPSDIPAFCEKIAEELIEGKHAHRAA
jgi:protease I